MEKRIEATMQARERIKALARSSLGEAEEEIFHSAAAILQEQLLYRGVRTPGMNSLQFSVDRDVDGVYLAFEKSKAIGFAINGPNYVYSNPEWAKKPAVVYSCKIANAKLLRLRFADFDAAPLINRPFSKFISMLSSNDLDNTLRLIDRHWSEEERDILFDDERFERLKHEEPTKNALSRNLKFVLKGTLAEYLMALGFDGILDINYDVVMFRPESIQIQCEELLQQP